MVIQSLFSFMVVQLVFLSMLFKSLGNVDVGFDVKVDGIDNLNTKPRVSAIMTGFTIMTEGSRACLRADLCKKCSGGLLSAVND